MVFRDQTGTPGTAAQIHSRTGCGCMQLHHSRSHLLVVESLEDRLLLSLSGLSTVVRGPETGLVSITSLPAPDGASQAQKPVEKYPAQVQTADAEQSAGAVPREDLVSARL